MIWLVVVAAEVRVRIGCSKIETLVLTLLLTQPPLAGIVYVMV